MILHEKIRSGVYVIAEIGCSHGGSMETAKEMIAAAAACGVDAVKSQKRCLADMPQELKDRPRTDAHAFGATEYEHRAALEFSVAQHQELVEYAHTQGVEYGLSSWDMQSTADCAEIKVDWIKVPSALNGNTEYLRHIAHYPRPLLASTGMLDETGVMHMTKILSVRMNNKYLLHCTSAYPCNNEDTKLAVIGEWKRWFADDYECVGFSGHHRGIQLDAAAVALGARIIERHFTLDRTSKGTDHAASIEPSMMSKLCRDVQIVYDAMGDGLKRVLPCEAAAMEKLRR